MPFISTKTNMEITKEKELSLKEKLGKAIACIPGKSESWLMLSFEGQCSMYFRGRDREPLAFVEVKIFGSASSGDYERLTAVLTEIYQEELGISPAHLYIKYEEVKEWGYNGVNF